MSKYVNTNMSSNKYLALSGGIGGAKLALGLDHCLAKSQLTVVANTGDDFEHLGLTISPDIDTLLYTLADLNNTELGWGRRDETWNFFDACKELGLETWFRLGDKDLATHIYRSQRMREGASLSQIVKELSERLNISSNIVPMSDEPVRTILKCDSATLSFQEYFVKNRCEPRVSEIYFEGVEKARCSQGLLDCLNDEKLQAIFICPSNPFLSIDPILAIPSLKESIKATGRPVIVVSPLIGGKSIKGPTTKLMQELDHDCDVKTIADLYRDIATTIVIDNQDENAVEEIKSIGLKVLVTNTLMNCLQDKINLAESLINYSNKN